MQEFDKDMINDLYKDEFDEFMVRYKEGLAIERAAVDHLKG